MSRRYNVAGQLVQQVEKENGGNLLRQVDFSYDAAGNIIKEPTLPKPASVSPLPVTMTYSAANRLATYNGQAVSFDADGNMVSGPLAGKMANFNFDSRNRLVSAGETNYRYDAENWRIGMNRTRYVINSQPALSQVLVKEENGVKTFYVYGLGLLGEEKEGEYRAYHFDFRGSTVALTDNAGKVVQQFQYGPYGELVKGNAAVTPFLFNGKYGVMTDSNGLYYMRARFYSAEMKRFVNMDVLLGNIAEGQTLNRFALVTGQPVNYVDPFGLTTIVIVEPGGASGLGHASIAIRNREASARMFEYFSFYPTQSSIIWPVAGAVYHRQVSADFFRWEREEYQAEFLIIKTTPTEEQEMIKFAKTLVERFAKQEESYQLFFNNCAIFVGRVLNSQLPATGLASRVPNQLIDGLKRRYDGEIMSEELPIVISIGKQVDSITSKQLINALEIWFDHDD